MSRSARKLGALQRRVPEGMTLPDEMTAFVGLVTDERSPSKDVLRVAWSNPTRLLNVERQAVRRLLPFLVLADGGAVALWQDDAAVRVVAYDSEGGHTVLATSFEDFVLQVGKPTADFRERLELDTAIDTSGIAASGRRKPVSAALQRRFASWLERHSLGATPLDSDVGRHLRNRLVAMARAMVTDGLSKVYKPRDSYWSMEFRLVRRAGAWEARYLDYGEWHEVPTKYGLLALVPALLPLMKRRKTRYELSVVKTGNVYVDGGNQLVLEA